jgi:hypothetical protein
MKHLLATALAAGSTTILINTNLPGSSTATTGIGGVVANFYNFALLIAGILAFGAIVWGGIKYATGRGNPTAETEGKSWITNALLGLLLLAGAWIILYTVNPQIVNLPSGFNLPALTAATSTGGGAGGGGGTPTSTPTSTATSTATSTCPLTALTTVTDPQAQQMENGTKVIWTSSDPNVQANLNALQTAFSAAQTLLSQKGDSITVNSVYRPLAYQAHLYDIYQHALQLKNNTSASNNSSCSSLISALQAEETKHGVCANSGSGSCLVAAPSCSAPHVLGIGIDLSLSGPVGLSAVNALLQSNNVNLQWRALSGDPVHFQLTNPPFSSCASN